MKSATEFAEHRSRRRSVHRPGITQRRQQRRRSEEARAIRCVTHPFAESGYQCRRQCRTRQPHYLHTLLHPRIRPQQALAWHEQRNRDGLRRREETRTAAHRTTDRANVWHRSGLRQQQNQYPARQIARDHGAARIPAVRECSRQWPQHNGGREECDEDTRHIPRAAVHAEHDGHLHSEQRQRVAQYAYGLCQPQAPKRCHAPRLGRQLRPSGYRKPARAGSRKVCCAKSAVIRGRCRACWSE